MGVGGGGWGLILILQLQDGGRWIPSQKSWGRRGHDATGKVLCIKMWPPLDWTSIEAEEEEEEGEGEEEEGEKAEAAGARGCVPCLHTCKPGAGETDAGGSLSLLVSQSSQFLSSTFRRDGLRN